MNQKQLANVLIKILGLSLLAQGVASFLAGMAFTVSGNTGRSFLIVLISSLAPAVVGIAIIIQSRVITEKLITKADE